MYRQEGRRRGGIRIRGYAGHLRKRAPLGIPTISTDGESKDSRNAAPKRTRVCRLSGNPNDAYLSSARYVLNVSTMRYPYADRYRSQGERGEVGTTGEARKLAGNRGGVYGRNEVESLRPDASLTMSNRAFTYWQACQTLVRVTSIRAMRLKSPRRRSRCASRCGIASPRASALPPSSSRLDLVDVQLADVSSYGVNVTWRM